MDDLISRQATIDAIKKCGEPYVQVFTNDFYVAVKAVERVPSAEPQRWIPVTERLPDKMGSYLVTVDYKEHGTGVMSLWFHNEEIGWDLRVADEVTAWMPLPMPWKGEDNE